MPEKPNQTVPNYGDVALDLPADWSRGRVAGDPSFILTTVGHENGVADAYLTNDPGRRHQFRWMNPKDESAKSIARTKKYIWVTKAEWTKNEDLWEWDGDGFILFNGTRLMARDAKYYYAEKAEEERQKKEREGRRSVTPEEEQAVRRLENRGIIVEDERGRQLKPLSKS